MSDSLVHIPPNRLLKKAHLRRWHARALAAAYPEYAWTHLRWVPRPFRAALRLNLFEQPERKRVFQHPANSEQDAFAAEGKRTEDICVNEYLEGA